MVERQTHMEIHGDSTPLNHFWLGVGVVPFTPFLSRQNTHETTNIVKNFTSTLAAAKRQISNISTLSCDIPASNPNRSLTALRHTTRRGFCPFRMTLFC